MSARCEEIGCQWTPVGDELVCTRCDAREPRLSPVEHLAAMRRRLREGKQ